MSSALSGQSNTSHNKSILLMLTIEIKIHEKIVISRNKYSHDRSCTKDTRQIPHIDNIPAQH